MSQRLVPRIDGGMVAAFEVLIANNAMRNLIREGKTHQIRNVIATSVKDGMRTLEASLSELVADGHDQLRRGALAGAVPQGDPPAPRAPRVDGAPDAGAAADGRRQVGGQPCGRPGLGVRSAALMPISDGDAETQ